MKIRKLFILALACAAPLLAAEDYSQWQFSRSIVVNTTATGANTAEPVYGFPLLVRLTPANSEVFGNTRNGGVDIRFTKADGTTRLPHEIERWDKVNQVAEIWVQVDEIPPAGYTTLRMFWSNPDAADSSSGAQVFNFSNGFAGTWHMGSSVAGNPRKNSVGNYNHAVPKGNAGGIAIPSVPGAIGLADSLRGNGRGLGFVGDHFDLGNNFPSMLGYNNVATLSMWVKPAVSSTHGPVHLLDLSNTDGANGENRVWMGRAADSGKLSGQSVYDHGSVDPLEGSANSLVPGEWQFVTYTLEEGENYTQRLYRNGALVGQNTGAQAVRDIERDFNYIGRSSSNGDSTFGGVVDEVIVSQVSRDSNWIRMTYATQKPGATAVILEPSVTDVRKLNSLNGISSIPGTADGYDLNSEGLTLYQSGGANVTLTPQGLEVRAGVENETPTNVGAGFVSTTNVYAADVSADRLYAGVMVVTPKWEAWPDYVFDPGHKKLSLPEIESFIQTNGRLPEMPSAREVAAQGVDVAEINMKLLKTVEELTLHVIDLDKKLRER